MTAPRDPEPGASAASMDAAIAALRSLILASQEFRQAVAGRLDVGVTDTIAMSYLADEGPLSARDLSTRMGIATSSVTTLLDRLEDAGLARRGPVPGDRRGVAVVLTDHGREALAWTRQWMHNALADLGTGRLEDAAAVLSSLAESLRAQIGELGSPEVPAPESRGERRRR